MNDTYSSPSATAVADRSGALTSLRNGWLDAAPLVRLVEARQSLPDRADREGERLVRAFYRAKRRGSLTLAQADLLCIQLLGCHPCEVYGRSWWDTLRGKG